jgi:hypothetical protein
MAEPLADLVYVVGSAVFLAVATVAIVRGLSKWLRSLDGKLSPELRVDLAAWLTLAGGVALLAFFSVWIETGERSVPPRDDPFFTMGRLISGCIVPFALLYVGGLRSATTRIPERARALVRAGLLALVVAVIAVSEARLSTGAARSEYNWFRLEHVAYGPCAAAHAPTYPITGALPAGRPAPR